VPGSKGGYVTITDAAKRQRPDGVPYPAALKSNPAAPSGGEAPAATAPSGETPAAQEPSAAPEAEGNG
jgi:large subunit ribosomal protein L3